MDIKNIESVGGTDNENINKQYMIHIVVLVLLVSIILWWVYIMMKKVLPKIIKNEILTIEYDKVGWKDNFDFMAKSTSDQLTKYREQNGGNVWSAKQPTNNNQAQNNNWKWATISLDKVKKITEGTYILWNPDAKISFVEYSDLECPFCKKLHNAWTVDKILADYNGEVNYIFKQFPLDFHANAQKEAEALLCAWDLWGSKKYYSYIDAIFKRTTSNGHWFALDALVPLAKELWLSEPKFKQCLDSGKYASRIISETSEWQEFGVTWTPWNVIINKETGEYKILPGAYPFDSFKSIIDGLLKK